MTDQGIVVLGIPVPSSSPIFFGILSFGAEVVGRGARRRRKPGWLPVHITGMSISYILLLTAFYVDNGAHLPVWRSLPALAYWIVPSVVGFPILVWVLKRHPLMVRFHSLPLRDAS
jgi:hypothetical protein